MYGAKTTPVILMRNADQYLQEEDFFRVKLRQKTVVTRAHTYRKSKFNKTPDAFNIAITKDIRENTDAEN